MKASVCLASYNGERFIKQQIQSILEQLDNDDELIISDNGSTDRTLRIISEFGDSRIRTFSFLGGNELHPHARITQNFEHALKQATGDLIFLADQDDCWEPNKLSITKSALAQCDLVTSDAYLMGDGVKNRDSSFFAGSSPVTGLPAKLFRLRYHGCTMAFRRSLLKVALPFPNGLVLHDGWLGLLAELTGRVMFIDQKLVGYRLHDSNSSTTNNSIKFRISYRWVLFKELFKRYKTHYPEANFITFITSLHSKTSSETHK